MVLIYQPPNAHERISWILLRNAMAAAAAVKKIYWLRLKLVTLGFDRDPSDIFYGAANACAWMF
jgi:hypothetical protein